MCLLIASNTVRHRFDQSSVHCSIEVLELSLGGEAGASGETVWSGCKRETYIGRKEGEKERSVDGSHAGGLWRWEEV
jgi:hypothetical protein